MKQKALSLSSSLLHAIHLRFKTRHSDDRKAGALARSISLRLKMMQWVQTPGEIYLTSVVGLLRWIRLVRAFLRRRRMQRALGL